MNTVDFIAQVKRILGLEESNDTDNLVLFYLTEVRRQYTRLSCYAEFLTSTSIPMVAGTISYTLPTNLAKIVESSVYYTDLYGNSRQMVKQESLLIRPEGNPVYWKRIGVNIQLTPNDGIQTGETLNFDYYAIPSDLTLGLIDIPEPNLVDLWLEAVLAKMSRTVDSARYKLFSSEESQAFRESRAAQD